MKKFSREVSILYEDPAVIVLDKPAGLAAVPVKGVNVPTVLEIVAHELESRRQRALVVHRIDRFTSGIIVFAKTARARDGLIKQFLAHTPVREYLAIVRGRLAQKEGTLVHYLRRVGMHQKLRSESDSQAARAELHYTVEQPLAGATLVRVTLITGLQNQIRVQFSAAGHPVFGDRKYHPDEATERRIDRVALHASHLEFVHPDTQRRIAIDSEPPGDFRSLLRALKPR